MIRLRTALLAFFVLAPARAHGDDLRTVYSRTQGSVLLLKTFDRFGAGIGQGTGFVVADGLVVTNYHVVADARSVTAHGRAGLVVPVAALLLADEENDIAILRLQEHALTPLALGKAPPAVGQHVIVVGSPLGLAGTLSEGIVSASRPEGLEPEETNGHRGAPLLQITAPISPGSSGSPVMDEGGNVLGVAVSGYSGAQNLNFAVPAAVVRSLLTRAKSASPVRQLGRAPTAPSATRNLIVSGVVLAIVVVAVLLIGVKRPRARLASARGHDSTVKPFRGRA